MSALNRDPYKRILETCWDGDKGLITDLERDATIISILEELNKDHQEELIKVAKRSGAKDDSEAMVIALGSKGVKRDS